MGGGGDMWIGRRMLRWLLVGDMDGGWRWYGLNGFGFLAAAEAVV